MKRKSENIKRLKLCVLASMLDAVLRSRGNVILPPPERNSEERCKDFFDSLRRAVVHDASMSKTILMNGFSSGKDKGSASVMLSVSLPMKKNKKNQKNKFK